jgi:hypothetical protein
MTTGATVHRVRADGLAWQQVGDESVVLDLQSSVYYSGNPSGTVLWQRLVDGATIEQLVDALTGGFEVTPEQARGDVLDFLDELRAGGLLLAD